MLTYKISTRDIKQDVQAVSLNENTVYIGEETIIVPSSNNGLRVNDFITFIRNDGDDIHYTEKVTVSDVLEDSFSIPKFSEKLLPIYNAGIVETKYHPNKNKRKFLVLLLTDDKHDFVEYRQDERYGANAAYIKEYIYDDYSAYIENMKRCNGDHILYEGVFLYTATVDAESGKYVFSGDTEGSAVAGTVENTIAFIYIAPSGELAEYISTHNNGGDSWELMEDGRICLKNCIIPANKDGQNDRAAIWWEARDLELATKIAKSARISTFSAEDVRFIIREDSAQQRGYFELSKGTFIQRTVYSALFSEPLFQDIGTNLFQEEAIKTNYVNNIIERYKNGIVDYEKKCFSPVYFENGKKRNVEEIKFNLHFRERIAAVAENSAGYTYGEWKTADNLFWNNYIKNGNKLEPKNGLNVDDADLLGYLGFTDEDIIRERKKVGKSFLRISFYDTPDRRTQKLLFTSTLFMNTGALYEQYSTNVRENVLKYGKPRGIETVENQYVYTENGVPRLSAKFTCKDKYSTKSSSEGFYLYLFPGLLDENGKGTIYMKAEFSHAKYGYTIPFILPVNSCNEPISPEDENFPIRYATVNERGQQYIDIPRLFNDMYIKVNIEYDNDSKSYVWYLPSKKWGCTPSFNLFEPRINAGEDFIVYTEKTENIAASGETINGVVHCGHEQAWEVSLEPSEGWAITPNSGNGETNFVIAIPENSEITEKNKHFEAIFKCGNETYNVGLNQQSISYNFAVVPQNIGNISWEGEQGSLTIFDEDNYGWEILATPLFAYNMSARSGAGTAIITFDVLKNETLSPRSGAIVIRDTRYYQQYEILLEQEFINSKWGFNDEYEDAEINIGWENGADSITLNDDDELGYEMVTNLEEYEWLQLSITENNGCYNFEFNFDENFERKERTASIIVKDGTYGVISRTIYITQLASGRGNVRIKFGHSIVEVKCGGYYDKVQYINGNCRTIPSLDGANRPIATYSDRITVLAETDFEYGTTEYYDFQPNEQGKLLSVNYRIDVEIKRKNHENGNTNTAYASGGITRGMEVPYGKADGSLTTITLDIPPLVITENNDVIEDK